MSIELKIGEVEVLLKKHREIWKDMRLLLITPHSWLRLYNDHLEGHEEFSEYVIIRSLPPKRGEILNIFSKIEYLVNQLIQAHVIGLFSPNARLLDDVLEYVDLASRIRLLRDWNILDKKEDEEVINIFYRIKEVRNGLAHRWKETEVFYRGQTLPSNLKQFREDLEKAWKTLIEKYMQEQNMKIDELITTITAKDE